jgi:RNA polymerase sigma-70 factor (ECF subfamily)
VAEVYQEYAKLLAEGSFANVEPARGKFRRYLKRALSNLVNDYYRRRKRQRHVPIDTGFAEPEARPEPEPSDDREFTAAWRRDLQELAWARLKQHERQTGKPLYTLLKHKVLHRDCRSYQMAEEFSELLGQAASANKVRKLLHQARGLYSEMLLRGVAETIDGPSAETLEEELIELDLHKYCRDALDDWKRRNGLTSAEGR